MVALTVSASVPALAGATLGARRVAWSWAHAIWTGLERVGRHRAAAELGRRARAFDGVDPARAALLRDAARACLDAA